MMSDPRSMSVKELKAAIIAVIGEAAFRAKNFVEKSEFVNFLLLHQEEAQRNKDGIFRVPAGKYILGDPCFMVTDVLHLETFQETYYDSEDEAASNCSEVKKNTDSSIKRARFNDSTVVTAFNAYDVDAGPTWYSDKNQKYSFLINGGVIALVPLTYNPHFSTDITEAHIVEFTSPAECLSKRGIITFGDIEIDTKKKSKAKQAGPPARGSNRAAKGSASGSKKRTEEVDFDDEEDIDVEDADEEEEFEDISSEDEDEWRPEKKRKEKKQKHRSHQDHGGKKRGRIWEDDEEDEEDEDYQKNEKHARKRNSSSSDEAEAEFD